MRQFIQLLPFAFEGSKGWNPPVGFEGYRHKKLKELSDPFPISFFIILFQDSLKSKIAYFAELTKF